MFSGNFVYMEELPPEAVKIGAGVAKVLYRTLGNAATAAIKNLVIRPLERLDAKKQTQSEVDLRIIEAIGDNELDAVESMDPQSRAEIIEESASYRSRWKQRNLTNSVVRALSQLSEDTIQNQSETVPDEFMDAFNSIAENKSTEDVQALFARILAGEIEKPGSFSTRALHVADQLDKSTAKLFQRFCSMAFVRERLLVIDRGRPVWVQGEMPVDKMVCSLGGGATNNSLEKHGLNFVSLSRLVEYGLVIPVIDMQRTYGNSVRDGAGILSTLRPIHFPIRYQGQYWTLRMFEGSKKAFGDDFKLSGVGFSAIGHELSTVVDPIDTPEYTKALIEFFRSQELQMLPINMPS